MTATFAPSTCLHAPPASPPVHGPWRWARRLTAILFTTAIFFACLRLYTTNNDFPVYWHPDEATKVNQILHDARNFNHPQLLLEAATQAGRWFGTPPTPADTVQVGRWCSAVFAAATVWALTWVGYAHGGLLGMVLMGAVVGLCPPLVTYAHYMKEDAALAVGVALSVLGIAAVCKASRWWTQTLAVGLLALGCGMASSGKYVGIATLAGLLVIPLTGWRHWTLGILWPLVFGAVFIGTVATINYRAFQGPHTERFEQALERESEHGTTEHRGLTMDRPNSYFADVLWRQTQVPALVLATVYILLLPLHWRRRGTWDLFIVFYSAFWLAVLSYGVIYFARYALPALLLVYALAGLGAYEVVRLIAPRLRIQRALVTLSLLGIVVAVQGPRVAAFTRQFAVENDTRTQLVQWVRGHLGPRDQVMAEWYSGLGWASVAPRVRGNDSAAAFGSIERLRQMGIGYVVVADIWYDRFFVPQVKPIASYEGTYTRTRAFYDDLFAHYPMVFRAKPAVNQEAFTSPEVRVYRISRP